VPSDPPPEYDEHLGTQMRRDHVKAMKASVWNEGQPLSPPSSSGVRPQSGQSTTSRDSSLDSHATPNTPTTPASDIEDSFQHQSIPLTAENLARTALRRDSRGRTTISGRTADAHDATRDVDGYMQDESDAYDESGMSDIDGRDAMAIDSWEHPEFFTDAWHDGHAMSDEEESSTSTLRLPSLTPSPPTLSAVNTPLLTSPSDAYNGDVAASMPPGHKRGSPLQPPHPKMYKSPLQPELLEDCITDTVGAIAIDNEGNIACGASSGGIGMKFRGRIGPAALVGVGAAVCPVDPEDKSKTCTGAVTSGTGEHMGTTLAANVCAERLYHGMKKRKGGGFEHAEDDQAVRSMIEHDFMGEYTDILSSTSPSLICAQIIPALRTATRLAPLASWRSRKHPREPTSTLRITPTHS